MRRIAHQLSDLFARHGLAAEPEATVTGRTRTSYRVPALVRTPAGPVLVDGDLESSTVDDGSVLRLYLMAVDCGAKALFLHSGHVPSVARGYADRVTLWPRGEAVYLLGETLWAAAMGVPLPALPGPLAAIPALVPGEPAPAPAPQPERIELVPPPAPEPEVVAPVPAPAAEQPFIDLDDTPTEARTVDLETGHDVVVTALPTTAADELATAEPLVADPAAVAGAPLPPMPPMPPPAAPPMDEAGAPEPAPVAAEAAAAEDGAAQPDAAAEPGPPAPPPALAAPPADGPLFQLPPAFRPEPVPLPVPEGSRGLLPARVTLEEARAAVGDRLFGIEEWELILQPVHLFDYTVEVLRSGSLQADAHRGRVQVNGTDRRVTAMEPGTTDPPARVFSSPDLTVMDKVLRVSPERAHQVVQEWAGAAYGKTVHVNLAGVDDTFDLLERRTIAPTSGQVRLSYLGIWHRPFWRLWGTNGHVDLDAVEGHVLDQELKTADPDVLEVH